MRRILSAWLPAFPITRRGKQWGNPWEQTGGLPDEAPVALVQSARGLRLLACVNAAAAAAGLAVGQRLTEAQAICPELVTAEADPAVDAAALQRLAEWCQRYTPMAAADPPDGLVLDISGCGHLFGGEAELADHLASRLARFGLAHRLAICGTAAAGWALARWAAPAGTPLILQNGAEMAALAGLPVSCLRLDAATLARLRRVGLKTVGEMARMPRGALAARFGALPLQRLEQALGQSSEAIPWPHATPPWEEQTGFVEPIGTAEALGEALDLLLGRLCVRLEAQMLGGRGFVAQFFRVDGAVPELAVATAQPVRAAGYVARLIKEKLDTLDPGWGIEAMLVRACGVEPLVPPQRSLDAGLRDMAADALPELLDRLGNRLGPHRLRRFAPQESHVPERAVRQIHPLDKLPKGAAWQPEAAAPRPLRLLRRPERISVTAPLPDGAPAMFHWRNCLHRVRAATGPERIAHEWWRARPPRAMEAERPETDRLRDYYQVEDSEGGRYWIFRAGLVTPAWYLHGLFG